LDNFVIEISSKGTHYMNEEDTCMTLSLSEYLDIMKLIKNLNLFDLFQKSVSSECSACRSFAVDTKILYGTVDIMINFMDSSEFEYDFESWGSVYDSLWDIRSRLMAIAYLTDKEWNDYYAKGLKEMDFIYEGNGELLTDSEGNHFRYASDRVVFKFDDNCECNESLK
jgi:hypothetical protein